MRRAFDDICDNALPYLYKDYAKDANFEWYLSLWTRHLLTAVCANAAETIGVERTLELLDAQRERLMGANVVKLPQGPG